MLLKHLRTQLKCVLDELPWRECTLCKTSFSPGRQPPSPLSKWLCTNCLQYLHPKHRTACIQCGLALGKRLKEFGWTRCRHCKTNPRDNLQTTVAFDYTSPFSQWISALKYGQSPGESALLGDAILEALGANSRDLPDVLIPAPISPKRLQSRGYNQAELIAKHLGNRLNIPVHTDWLVKTRDTPSQAQLSKKEREQNLRNSIASTRPIPASIKLGLVDDVITTGATLKVCLAVLEKSGGSRFHFLAACRTPE